ncbi:MAG: DUF5711 family protein [Eubacterium sp.]|nr:DUF5711 family protein [Eubacterium sp.]
MAELFQIREKYRSEIEDRKKTRWMIAIVVSILVVGIGIVIAVSYYYNNRCFNSCRVESQVQRNDSNSVSYRYFRGDFLKYSRNGISAVDSAGKSLWNGGYEMKQPQVDTCEEYVSVADVMGKQVYVYNGLDEGTSIETALPVVRAKVSEKGIVAALVQDSDSNVLNIYNPYSSADGLLVEIPTNVSEEGYPLDFDISPDGNSVVTSYLSVSGVAVENKISFYNFTAVGQDKNTLVGGKSFGDKMISCVEFLGEDTVAVFHENGFSLFTQMKQPVLLFEKEFEEDIRSIAYDEDYIAVVTGNSGKEEKQILRLFSLKGKEIFNRPISFDYSKMELYEDEIIFSGNHHCNIVRLNGRDKLDCEFEDVVEGVFPTENGSIYTLIDAAAIKQVKLEMK